MASIYKVLTLIGAILLGSIQIGVAQDIPFQENITPGIIRIAGPGQLADTLNIWGDVKVSGRYLVPRTTSLTELISMAKGPIGIGGRDAFTNVDLEIYVSSYNERTGQYEMDTFSLQLNEPFPREMRNYPLHNGDVITVKADQDASFIDYFSIIAPIITLGFTAFIVVDRLQD